MTQPEPATSVSATSVSATSAPEAFAAPDAAHSPAAYWFWHHLPAPDEIRAQVNDMLAGGYQSFQIQPRLAYPIDEYLGQEYLAACRIAVDEAARLGMTVGIYDEYSWQSGQAAGRTVHGADHLRECHAFWSTADSDGDGIARLAVDGITSSAADLGAAGLAWQYDDSRVAWADWRIIAAVAYPAGGARSLDEIVDVTAAARLTATTEDGFTAQVQLPAELAGHRVTVWTAGRCATSRLPNYLLAESARRFIEVGYEPYYATFGEHFGSTVTYIFFDQPHATFYNWPGRHGNLGNALPYAHGVDEQVAQRTGHSFGHTLLALLDDVGPQTVALRCGFYEFFTELTCTAYLGTLHDWCRDHDVALSGHEVLGHVGSWNTGRAFSSWDLRVNFGMDYFGVDSYRDLTGVDAEDCVPQLSTKLGDSVARSNGRSGCIVEQYIAGRYSGGLAYSGDWGLTLTDLRAQAIRLQLAGARQFLFHGYYQTDGWDNDPSMFANPRFDFPPGINFEPWWLFHRPFAHEMGRLSVFLDGGSPATDVALFYPLRTCWAEGRGHDYNDHVEFWASLLAEAGFGFHLIDERDLLAARADGGALRIGDRDYGCLILPSVSTLASPDSMAVLDTFAAGGGLLVSSGQAPGQFQAGTAAQARSSWAGVVAAGQNVHCLAGLPAPEVARDVLSPLLGAHPHARAAAGTAAKVWQWAGHDGEAWRLAVFNDSIEPADVVLSGGGSQQQVWDVNDGTLRPWQAAPRDAVIRLAPMELRTLRLRSRAADPAESASSSGHDSAPAAGAVTAVPAETELPLPDGWTLRLPDHADVPIPVRVDQGWEQQGFPEYSGPGIYSRTIEASGGRRRRLRLPGVHTAVQVRLNGELIGARAWAPYEFELTGLRETGNELEVTVFSAAANKYYAGTPYRDHPQPSGLTAIPVLSSPRD